MTGPADTERAREVRRRHAGELLARKGVVSVGVGVDAEGAPALVVGTVSAEASRALALPEAIEDVPVVVRVVGELEARE